MPSARRTSQAATATSSSEPNAKITPGASAEAGPSTTKQSSSSSAATKDEASTDAHLELLTEHFGFNPKSFIDSLVFLSNEHLYAIATEFERVVADLLADTEGGELEAEQGIHAILTLVENALDHTMDTFELYCFRSVFGIRARQAKYMTLDHHRGLDLRQQKSGEKAKASRKSIIAGTGILSANERSYQLGETEDSLKRQIAAARATQHKLLLAQNATQTGLDRMLNLAERFSSVLAPISSDASTPSASVLTETLGQHARKLKADTIPLLKALRELRSADPLGAPLYSGPTSADNEGEEDGVGAGRRVWEGSREGYLNWEADRIIAKSKRGAAAPSKADASAGEAEGESDKTQGAEDDSKTPKRKRTIAGAPTSSKRRTPGTASRTRG